MATISKKIRELLERSAGLAVVAGHKVVPPPEPSLGDLSSNIALVASRQPGQPPLELAKDLAQKIQSDPSVDKASAAPPGFINITLSKSFLTQALDGALRQGYGSNQSAKGKKARVEFVSANPTGPLHIGNARGGPLGDTIANVLSANGYKVLREYLHNDVGGQVKQFGETIVGKGIQYRGHYIDELRRKIKTNDQEEAGEQAVELLFSEIMDDCKAMGIRFDKIYKESEFKANQTQRILDKLTLKKKDEAQWYELTGAQDTVVVRSTGEPTYFANDIAYHDLKFAEGYNLVIDVLGSNHHGHVPKLQKVIGELGYNVEKFKVVLYQFVRVKRGTEVVKMSKRAGTFVTAREVLDEVGKDAFRFFMLLHEPDTHMDFDLELAKKQSKDNPVYYVQYAIARIYSILAKIKNQKSKIKIEELELDNPKIRQLVLQLIQYPDLVAEAGQTLEVHHLSHYALKTAGLFHDFYESVPVIKAPEGKRESRLALAKATLNVLEHCLGLLGVSAPQRM